MAKKRKLPPDPEGMNDDRAEWADFIYPSLSMHYRH